MRTLLVRVAMTAACTIALTACAAGGETPGATREALATRVGVLVDAANREDFATVRTALTALRGDVSAAQRLGFLTSDRAGDLLRLADGVEAALPVPVPPSVVATSAPTVAPRAPRSQAPQPAVPQPQAPQHDPEKDGGQGKGGSGKSSSHD